MIEEAAESHGADAPIGTRQPILGDAFRLCGYVLGVIRDQPRGVCKKRSMDHRVVLAIGGVGGNQLGVEVIGDLDACGRDLSTNHIDVFLAQGGIKPGPSLS